ncbi:sigma 54-interacting transcriptional regulator [Syntrophomonas erecta]
MQVKDIMTHNPLVLSGKESLRTAAGFFLENHIDGAPVVDEEGNLAGLLTKSHILRAVSGGDDLEVLVEQVMERQVTHITAEQDLQELTPYRVGRFPVVEQGKVVGIVTRSDLARTYYHSTKGLEQELTTVIDSVHNGIVTIDEKGDIRVFNTAAEKILGVGREEAIGRPLTNILPDSTLDSIIETGKTEFSQKLTINNRTLISNRTPIIVGGNIIGAVAVLQDISELEHISQELRLTWELKEELAAIIGSSFDGIYVTDGQGKTLRFNEAYSRITGIKPEEVIGKTMHQLVEEGVYDQSATVLVMEKLKPVTITQEVKTGKSILVQEQLNKYRTSDKYVFKSHKAKDLIDLVMRLGQVDSTVLITGESGVGKEIIVEILHSNSIRKDKPMVSINCGAIPESLLESELFGYESGAFTGAKKGGKMGLFEIANGGTIFLDEIGELPLQLQVKLLRVIQEREITRVGGTKPIKVDVRIIAATNRDLWEMVLKDQFRRDLFYRLNVVPVNVPPLRERKEEIPALASHFMHLFNSKYELNKRLDSSVITKLINYDWPGNIRELENVIERAVVTYPGDVIYDICLPESNDESDGCLQMKNSSAIPKLKSAVENLEKHLIENALKRCGSTRKAAAVLGVSQPTVVRKAARYGVVIEEEKAIQNGIGDTNVDQ